MAVSKTKVVLSNRKLVIAVGETVRIGVTFVPEDAEDRNILWKTDSTKRVSVDQKGNVTGLRFGETYVNAVLDNGFWQYCHVKVVESRIKVTGVTLPSNDITLKKGDLIQLIPTILPEDASNKEYQWSFENDGDTTVITVNRDSGMVMAHNYGTARAIVTTEDGLFQAVCNITVPRPVKVTGVSLNTANVTMTEGETLQLNAVVAPEDADNKAVTWSRKTGSTSAKVSTAGIVTAVSPGKTTIIATTKDGKYKATCVVTVVKKKSSDNSDSGDDSGNSDNSKGDSDGETPQPSGGGDSGGTIDVETKAVTETRSTAFFDGIRPDAEILDITSVGNTLIIATEDDIYYFLWRNGEYTFLGNRIPVPAIHFHTQTDAERKDVPDRPLPTPTTAPILFDGSGNFKTPNADWAETFALYRHLWDAEILEKVYPSKQLLGTSSNKYRIEEPTQTKWLDELWGFIDEKITTARESGKTYFPVFVRYGVRLYDGTLYAQSIPILLGADVRRLMKIRVGVFGNVVYNNGEQSPYAYIPTSNLHTDNVDAGMEYFGLYVDFPEPYSIFADYFGANVFDGWDDIVSGIDIFISSPIAPEQRNAVSLNAIPGFYAESEPADGRSYYWGIYNCDIDPYYTIDHQEELIRLHQMTYLAQSFSLDEYRRLSGDVKLNINFSADYILAQKAMEETPWSMHHSKGSGLFNYNNRLLITDASQALYNGYEFLHSVIWKQDNANEKSSFRIVYYIRGENGENVVICRNETGNALISRKKKKIGQANYVESPYTWLAYPDSRCYRIEVYEVDGNIVTKSSYKTSVFDQADVAYAFIGFAQQIGHPVSSDMVVDSLPSYENATYNMPNTLLVSKANNPFVFPAEDSVTLAVGKIMNIAVATTPLSEGQFGQFPLYLFTDEGVFAMTVNTEGKLLSSHNVSRDILLSKNALTGIEQGVFFAASRGLLLLRGSSVMKVSSEMDGNPDVLAGAIADNVNALTGSTIEKPQPFQKFLSGSFLAYDYANARIIISNPNYTTQYVYKMDTQSWHRLSIGSAPIRALNSFPEAQIVFGTSRQTVLNFSVLAENAGAVALPGVIYSRDLALDGADIYKAISRLRVRGRFKNGHVRWQLQGSNDGMNYTTIHSLHGPSWKWYRIILVSLLEPKERISYIELDYTPKFTDVIR